MTIEEFEDRIREIHVDTAWPTGVTASSASWDTWVTSAPSNLGWTTDTGTGSGSSGIEWGEIRPGVQVGSFINGGYSAYLDRDGCVAVGNPAGHLRAEHLRADRRREESAVVDEEAWSEFIDRDFD